jgi:hypothetical protein
LSHARAATTTCRDLRACPGTTADGRIDFSSEFARTTDGSRVGGAGLGIAIPGFSNRADIARGKGVPADITLFVDGKPVGGGSLPVTIPLSLGLAAGVSIGTDAGAPVMTDYAAPFTFTGTVKKVLVDVSGEAVEDQEARMKLYLARQ